MSNVLVLNKNWQPVHVCNPMEAISKLYQGIAKALCRDFQMHDIKSWAELSEIMDAEGNEFMHSPSCTLMVPEVIVLTTYNKLPPFHIRLSRRNLFLRDDYQCQYCGKHPSSKELTIDHILPRAKGGRTSWTNVALACIDCNSKKGSQLLSECGMKLRRKPKKPSWKEIISKKSSAEFEDHPLWGHFLDAAYWNVTLES